MRSDGYLVKHGEILNTIQQHLSDLHPQVKFGANIFNRAKSEEEEEKNWSYFLLSLLYLTGP